MNWTDLITDLAAYTQQEQPDASFTVATPNMVNSAELRIYRDLDMAASSGQNFSLQTTAASKSLDLSMMTGQTVAGGFPLAYSYPSVLQGIAAKVGNRWIPFQLASLEWVDMCWPNENQTAAPVVGFAYYCVLDSLTVRLAPIPDRVYPLRITGQFRPAPMSETNPTTWLGENIPDLLFAAIMCEAFGYQRDWGAQADDPKAAMSWETRYHDLLRSAKGEELDRQGHLPGPTMPPAPAQPAPGG